MVTGIKVKILLVYRLYLYQILSLYTTEASELCNGIKVVYILPKSRWKFDSSGHMVMSCAAQEVDMPHT